MLQSLLPGVRDLSLQPVDRLGLQNDLFSLVKFPLYSRVYKWLLRKTCLNFGCLQSRAGMISTVEVLKLMEAFVNEPNYTVWSDLSCNLGVLSSLLSHSDFHEEIQEFIRDLFTPIGMKLGWDSKPGEGERGGSGSGNFSMWLHQMPGQPNRCLWCCCWCRRSPGCPVKRSGAGEAGEGRAQTHPGGGQEKIQGPCGGQTSPSCRPQKPSKRPQPVDAFPQHWAVSKHIKNRTVRLIFVFL